MKTYCVQLNDLDHHIAVGADENPETVRGDQSGTNFLVFKRGGAVVGRSAIQRVFGWWIN